MGDQRVRHFQSDKDKGIFLGKLVEELAVFESMLSAGAFERFPQRIGAEQELALIGEAAYPSMHGPDILQQLKNVPYTPEIGRFNLEINLDPQELGPSCLELMEKQLKLLLQLGRQKAEYFDTRFLLTGILPTIGLEHLHEDCMSPVHRYLALSKALRESRGSDFEIHILGVDELMAQLPTLLFEACNTSFQMHLQLAPENFVSHYNWAQMVAGPVLAATVNSPMLFGRELWAETRIALFQQSIDTRSSANLLREKQPRVFFGSRWLQHSIAELFKEQIARFPVLLVSDIEENAAAEWSSGTVPQLKALRLHNGTVYSWNRACYGVAEGKGHVRIECRYIPSGPSAGDEMANFTFWLGLMLGFPEEYKDFFQRVPFRQAKSNFYRAARLGLHSFFDWMGTSMPAPKLILDVLLPIAVRGLQQAKLLTSKNRFYLEAIESRVRNNKTGADWQIRNYRRLHENWGQHLALSLMVNEMYENQESGLLVHQWAEFSPSRNVAINVHSQRLSAFMSTDLFSVSQEEPMIFVKAVMGWRNIRHLPVEDDQGNLIGLVTATNLAKAQHETDWEKQPVSRFMVKKVITAPPEMPIQSAIGHMKTYKIGCLPVVRDHKLIGIITDTDVKKIESQLFNN